MDSQNNQEEKESAVSKSQEEKAAPKKKKHKVLKGILTVLLALVIILVVGIFAIWHNEISAIMSIRQIAASDKIHFDGAIYEMTIPGGYYFDDFIAQGGAKTDDELLSFIIGNITKGLIPLEIEDSTIACSSFTAVTEDGHRLFGRNYDFAKTNICIVHTNPGGGRHASVSTIDLQFIGVDPRGEAETFEDKVSMLAAPYVPLDGVNDAGVACGIYMSYQGPAADVIPTDQQTERPDLNSTTMLRLILDYADDVDEAIELVSQYDLHDSADTSFHYMVADAQGNSAVLEWINGTDATDTDGTQRVLQVTRCDGTTFQTVTNYIIYEGYYDDSLEVDMMGLDRNLYLQEALGAVNGQVKDMEEAMSFLQGVGRRTWNLSDSAITCHSVVYDLTDCTALWVGNEHYGEEAYTLHLSVK